MENSRNDYNYNCETSDPYAPKYDEKIEFCSMKLRESDFLDHDEKRHLANGVNLHKDNLMFDQKARDMKKEFLDNIIESQSFVNAALPTFNFNMFLNE